MRTVGLKILKNKLSEYVRLAAAGGPLLALDGVQIGAAKATQGNSTIPHAELAFDLYAMFQRNRASCWVGFTTTV